VLSVGDSRRLRFSTFTPAGKPAAAAAVQYRVIEPSGLQIASAPFSPEEGVYEVLQTFNAPGLWQWSFQASGGPTMRSMETDAILVGGSPDRPDHPWCSVDDLRSSAQLKKYFDDGSMNLELLERACMSATEFLHDRTFRRFRGLRETELRPCCHHVWRPLGELVAWLMGSGDPPIIDEPAGCGCSRLQEFRLPSDVRLVSRVLIDGAVFTDWRLDYGRLLVRTDGDSWPCCQDMDAASSEADTFAVEAVVGERELELARLAAMELTPELYLAVGNPSECRIPTKVKEVNRQGSRYVQVEQASLDANGNLGLRVTDLFLGEYGQKKSMRMSIASPDVPPRARRRG